MNHRGNQIIRCICIYLQADRGAALFGKHLVGNSLTVGHLYISAFNILSRKSPFRARCQISLLCRLAYKEETIYA